MYRPPPYNTGKKFIYSDDYSTDPKLVTKEDAHKHSKYLSFMKRRLILAKKLLNKDGVIFVSINDNEQSYLKVLMDEILGEDNFIANLDWILKPGGQSDNKYISTTKQYILMYRKSSHFTIANKFIKIDEKKIYGWDERGEFLKSTELNSPAGKDGKYAFQRINLAFHISYNPLNNNLIFEPSWDLKKSEPIKPIKRKNYYIASPKKNNLCWRWNEKAFREKFNDVIWETNDSSGTLRVFKKQYILPEGKKTFIKDDVIRNINQSKGTQEFKSIFNHNIFDYPKPSSLIIELLKLQSKKNAVILDFFAGSETTGQATMELNREDNGSRRFILATNNKMEGYNTEANPEYGIARAVTRERLFRVINGKGSNGEEIKWQLSKELQKNNNKYLSKNSVHYLKVKTINKVSGNFEDIDGVKSIFKNEFNREIDIIDLNGQEE
ncbi:MAG: site-specific DNA-methyltransferase [Mollicutes bacterium PWAP]|nr:site-specific DNA-methyltransferase [Mollicutes bacterium PWAP]